MSIITDFPRIYPRTTNPTQTEAKTPEETVYNTLYSALWDSGILQELFTLGVARDKAGLDTFHIWKSIYSLHEMVSHIKKLHIELTAVAFDCAEVKTTQGKLDAFKLLSQSYNTLCLKESFSCSIGMANLITLIDYYLEPTKNTSMKVGYLEESSTEVNPVRYLRENGECVFYELE